MKTPTPESKNELIGELTVKDGVVMADSRSVAQRFEKRHDNVLRAVRNLDCSPKFTLLNFEETVFVDKNGDEQPQYLMTRDGFSFLVMGFTGKEAARWKEQYIGAFNAMEAQLRSQDAPQADGAVDRATAREFRLQHKMYMDIATMAGLEGNNALIAANNGVRAVTGHDSLEVMGITHLRSKTQSPILNVSGVSERIDDNPGARRVNQMLVHYGYQTAHRDSKGRLYYEPTSKGFDAGAEFADTGKKNSDGTPVTQLRWRADIVDRLTADIAASKPEGDA